MCRANCDGGRRCPSQAPAARAAQRKARRSLKSAPTPLGPGGTTATPAPASLAEDLAATWQPDRVTHLAQHVSTVLDDIPWEGDDNDPQQVDAYYKHRNDAHESLESLGGHETVTRALGGAIAAEAERRAGVTIADIQRASEAHREYHQQQAEKAAADRKAAISDLETHGVNAPVRQATQDLKDAKVAFDDPAADAARERLAQAIADRRNHPITKRLEQAEQAEHRHRVAADYESPQEATDAVRALSASYREVLSEVRGLGGVQTTWSPETKPKTAKAFDAAAQFYPTDWLEEHNQESATNPVYARETKGRAYFADRTEIAVTKRVPDEALTRTHGEEPEDTPWESYRPATEDDVTARRLMASQAPDFHVRTNWEVKGLATDESEPPSGKGWQIYEHDGERLWRRPAKRTEKITMWGPEITASPDPKEPLVPGASAVRLHELAHRFESLHPSLERLQEDFLRRRTTDADGNREPLVALYGGKKHKGRAEVARPDSFADAYMGKQYESDHREVLSTGVEALFAGAHGGLVGRGRYAADGDMRSLILGCLVAVGRSDRTEYKPRP